MSAHGISSASADEPVKTSEVIRMKNYCLGIDIGSTTVKVVVIDEQETILFGKYQRHCSHPQETVRQLLEEAYAFLGETEVRVLVTGSGAMSLGKALRIGFIQEVVATCAAIKKTAPQTDVAIELGGEDAKIIYFGTTVEERMNGVCAGGTGSFIDQMASLLQTDANGLNEFAKNYKEIYPIAARCGVFAKTDIQPLINEGATKEDLSASIYQAVVNQTISGLACGKPIKGCVAFLGGPLHYMSELKKAFIRTLKLTEDKVVDPENSHLFAAYGSALNAKNEPAVPLTDLLQALQKGVKVEMEIKRLPPLFKDEADYKEFLTRHQKAVLKKQPVVGYEGNCFLGIDAGSTTTKLALIAENGDLLYAFYANNKGNPIQTSINAILELKEKLSPKAKILRSCSTGYGEALLKTAFCLDEGEVETIAHCTAAAFFDKDVDCVLDIGGQDMKCIKIKNNVVENVILNEACSSGCGSFIENFASSLGYTAQEFSQKAIHADTPIDLGTRCTVFMNSNVKQAQKEGASVSDISAGLAYSVVKNALFKVIKLVNKEDLGKHVVVQGGTFYNHAVLRALELILEKEVVCPDISGIMGAFGAALIAKNRYKGQQSSMLPLDEIIDLKYTATSARCKGCTNNCMLTVNSFGGNRRYITGNRCEKGIGEKRAATQDLNVFAYKKQRYFDYEPLTDAKATRGVIGIPRVLNMYENYPFWATFFKALSFKVVLSPFSNKSVYELGIESIPSESECYPAKLAHGHVKWLIDQGVKNIFHPCVFYEQAETKAAQNYYNCPMVISYPENLKNNVEEIDELGIRYLRPFLSLKRESDVKERLVAFCKETWDIPKREVERAVRLAWEEWQTAKADVKEKGKAVLAAMREQGKSGIVLAGRPYHVDPEINHGVPELISSYGFAVFTEDCLPIDFTPTRPLRAVDQWSYHSRLYNAAEFVSRCNDVELIQLNSFGCGLDAVTTDQVSEILEKNNKIYTVLKIDEVNNLGAIRIRIRSLIAAIKMRGEQGILPKLTDNTYRRTEYTKEMNDAGYTLLAPQMSPIHFRILEAIMKKKGYNVVVLDNDNKHAVDTGLQYVNNDACYPSIVVVGQIMEAVLSGRYDTNKLAILMTQTGGCCRASNYVGFIRRALDKTGNSHIPVVSLNFNGMEKNSGFKLNFGLLIPLIKGILYGDLLMRCLYRTRPYEKEKGAANALYQKLTEICKDSLTNKRSPYKFKKVCKQIVEEFDALPLDESLKKPRVGVVGEILVKYMPLANNRLVDVLEKEGCEAVVPDLIDFFNYGFYNGVYKAKFLGHKKSDNIVSNISLRLVEHYRKYGKEALKKSKRFSAPATIAELAEQTKPILSIGNQAGEGWFLTGEMIELLKDNVPNIVCIQPFACLPNHVVGKGVIKKLKATYPQANIVAIDYDPGASEVNQLNRIKLMLSTAKERV